MNQPCRAILGCLHLAAMAGVAQGQLVKNGSFKDTGPTSSFQLVNGNTTDLPWWSTSGNPLDITCLVFPGTATTNACGDTWPIFKLWPGPKSDFPYASPDGGNAIGMDGDPAYASTLSQMIHGLVVGQSYVLSFWQLAGQPNTPEFGPGVFEGATTERWRVTLGAQTLYSSLMFNKSHDYVPWQHEKLFFTVKDPTLLPGEKTSQLLGFLADGTPGGLPPVVGLDGVVLLATPEPAAYAMVGLGLMGILLAHRHRRRSLLVEDCQPDVLTPPSGVERVLSLRRSDA
jgi:hypothetical protein